MASVASGTNASMWAHEPPSGFKREAAPMRTRGSGKTRGRGGGGGRGGGSSRRARGAQGPGNVTESPKPAEQKPKDAPPHLTAQPPTDTTETATVATKGPPTTKGPATTKGTRPPALDIGLATALVSADAAPTPSPTSNKSARRRAARRQASSPATPLSPFPHNKSNPKSPPLPKIKASLVGETLALESLAERFRGATLSSVLRTGLSDKADKVEQLKALEKVEREEAAPSRPFTPNTHIDWADADDDQLPDLDDWGVGSFQGSVSAFAKSGEASPVSRPSSSLEQPTEAAAKPSRDVPPLLIPGDSSNNRNRARAPRDRKAKQKGSRSPTSPGVPSSPLAESVGSEKSPSPASLSVPSSVSEQASRPSLKRTLSQLSAAAPAFVPTSSPTTATGPQIPDPIANDAKASSSPPSSDNAPAVPAPPSRREPPPHKPVTDTHKAKAPFTHDSVPFRRGGAHNGGFHSPSPAHSAFVSHSQPRQPPHPQSSTQSTSSFASHHSHHSHRHNPAQVLVATTAGLPLRPQLTAESRGSPTPPPTDGHPGHGHTRSHSRPIISSDALSQLSKSLSGGTRTRTRAPPAAASATAAGTGPAAA
ncbi:hypothetical protein BOTBODRAFT_27074 [Botryobasidium botryosum FD-172 SS1]|uniref:Uncharacterized protein n=1 Tax=Botryobasidium botryosum (strain FD-172 SS1) TaxID=930990 RepID=A0A067NAA6_BOTB1|nr:hypothetical protein BOTBODRAFT_27074 [Botryobasidium botryosum FD-172 SS1]